MGGHLREFLRGFLMQDGLPPALSVLSPLSTPPRRPKPEVPKPEPQVIIKEKYIYVHVEKEESGAGEEGQSGAEEALNRLSTENEALAARLRESEAMLSAATRQLSQQMEAHELLRSQSEVLSEQLQSVKTELLHARDSLL